MSYKNNNRLIGRFKAAEVALAHVKAAKTASSLPRTALLSTQPLLPSVSQHCHFNRRLTTYNSSLIVGLRNLRGGKF